MQLTGIFNSFISSADPSAIVRDDGCLIRINPAFRKELENDNSAFSDYGFYDLFIKKIKNDFRFLLEKNRHEKGNFYYDTQHRNSLKEIKWIQWNIIPHKKKRQFFASGRDITLLKQKEEQLRISYTAMETAANGIYLMNKDKNIIWVNSSFSKITGYSREETEGKNPKILSSGVHSEDFFRLIIETLNTGMIWAGEIVNRKPDGTLYTVEQTVTPVFSPSGELSHFVAIMQDISDRKNAEKLLQEHLLQLQRDIDLAGKIQKSLLPAVLPELEGYEISAKAIPAQYVSGDLYDCFIQDNKNCFLAMADISGKGIPAAMLASSLKTLLQSGTGTSESTAQLLQKINNKLYRQLSHAEKFITLCVAEFNPENGLLNYSSAGHTQAIIIRSFSNSVELLASTGIPLGILENAEYSETGTFLAPGDCFIIYSDGITEACNEDEELFGIDRLIASLKAHSFNSAEDILTSVIDSVGRFRKDVPLSDDISLITFASKPRTIEYSVKADIKNLEKLNSVVRNALSAYGVDFSYAVELSASELFTNIILHSHKDYDGNLNASLLLDPDKIELDVIDSAPAYEDDFKQVKKTDMLEEGGHGLGIIQKLTDDFSHRGLSPKGNIWHIEKRR